MRFLSLFSGIEAASEAWAPIGWECAGVSEIDPFACAVLAHRHPHVPNLGDITKITEMQIAALGHIDLIVFGSPCQDLSVAGKQKGLSGERSGLFYPAVDIINWARLWCGTRFALWENVPGAFSSNKGRDFAAVVGTLAGLDGIEVPPKGWGTEGCAVGTEAMVEWATLDAQWFGVAQRRRRIFALADFGDWAGRPPILLEPESVRGDSAPSREAGQGIAGSLAIRTTGGGFPGTDEACSGFVQPVRRSLTWPAEVCSTLDTTFGAKQGLEDQRVNAGCPMFVPSAHVDVMPTLRSGGGSAASHGAVSGDSKDEYVVPVCTTGHVTHTLTAEGFDASEDGTGRGTPVVAYAVALRGREGGATAELGDDVAGCLRASAGGGDKPHVLTVAFHSNAQADQLPSAHRDTSISDALTCSQTAAVAIQDVRGFDKGQNDWGWNDSGTSYTVDTHATQGVAYCTREVAQTITGNYGKQVDNSDTSLGPNVALHRPSVFSMRGFSDYGGHLPCLRASGVDQGGGSESLVSTTSLVRRLTPVECERLQGFPDNHTQIPWRKKPASECPDGPRYKALGNSMAVPVMRWIGQKIDVALLFQE